MANVKTYQIGLCNGRSPLNSSDVPPESTVWVGASGRCLVDGSGVNTGMWGYTQLELTNAATNEGLGVFKPNDSSDPDYIPPVSNPGACPVPIEIAVEPQSVNVLSPGTVLSFDITSNTSWQITNYSSGLSFNKLSGSGNDTVDVTVSENVSDNAVTKSFFVKASDGNSVAVTINQAASDSNYLEVVPSSLSFSPESGTKAVEVITSQTWSFTDTAGWASVNRNGNILTVYAPSNPGGARYGSINIQGQNSNASVSLSQQGVQRHQAEVLGRGTIVGEYEGAETAYEALFNRIGYLMWTNHPIPQPGSVYYTSPLGDTPVNGQGDWYLHGVHVVQIGLDGWAGAVIPVGDVEPPDPDPGPSNGISPTSLIFPASGGRENIQITALNNAAWTASTDGVGVQLNDSIGNVSGNGSGQISVSVPPNMFNQTVTFRVTVNIGGSNYNCNCSVAPAE